MAEDGLRVCAECRRGFERDLTALPELYGLCEKVLATPVSKGERVTRSPGYGISLNLIAVDARDLVRARLSSWADLVVDERECTPPERTIPALSGFLLRHTRWLCAHSAASDAVCEIAETAAEARSAAYPRWSRKFRVGGCVEPGCGGHLFAVIRSNDRLLPSEVRCEANPEHVWPAHQWRELDRRVNSIGAARWLTVAEVAQLWKLSTSNVYRLASVHNWRRRVSGRRVFYYEHDVVESVG
ncbi:hypothetical protein QQG74_20685 [Micromonospora sp. FIMYZ51]|uniref:helix-turn-helix transcriptional regulator n=1 Tax=Micromonospora sp. FIMYZ51 TaxID=3051832 RepID=UPI00311DB004